jgi:alpha-D-xyloside xylohydrolase
MVTFKRRAFLACVWASGILSALAQAPKSSVVKSAQGFTATMDGETLAVTVCSDAVVHVVAMPQGSTAHHAQPWLLPAEQSCAGGEFTFAQDADKAAISTAKLKVELSLTHGNLSFKDANGKGLLRESDLVPRTYAPEVINGEAMFHVVDRFRPNATEALYGLGQHQSGMFNYRGSTVELGQNNTDVAIPFMTSSNGYGIVWNTAAFTYMDNRFPLELSFDSLAGDGVDYFVIYGPEMDDIIHGYRNLTGHAPMLPRWAYGFIQSKDRYLSLDEIEDVAKRYRSEHIPMDAVVQDWFWWKHQGDAVFNDNYHDVAGDLKKLHDDHVHTMISTWGLLDPASETYKKMDAEHLLIGDSHTYDPSNAKARDMYWDNLPGKLFAEGWDSFWLDSAEPEEASPHSGDAILRDKTLSIGNGAMYTNVYPLLHNAGVQDHWRKVRVDKRTFLLTRSAFLGQQRVGGTVWSGDVYSSWWALSRQVEGGLNFALSGMPYWTTDIGGYHPLFDGQSTTKAYEELYLRWFEFGVFCPVFRTHGHRPHNELWAYPDIEPTLVAYDKLRYRLMPYIYSTAWRVSQEDYTVQRPLVMDFRADPATWNIGDQFLFGPSLLVSPVVEESATERSVYLPKGAVWYDFWTGETKQGGVHVQAAAPMDRIPLYVRAGSIVPMGPDEDYADEKVDGPIELLIYPGADGRFTLYQDVGDGYGYEKGQSSTIDLAWSDAEKTLTVGARKGSFAGMAKEMTFHLVIVGPRHGVGGAVNGAPDKTVVYKGEILRVKI